MKTASHIIIILVLSLFSLQAYSDNHSSQPSLQIATIASGLGVPWGMTLLSDNTMLISQREGIVSQLNLDTKQLITISGLPKIKVGGQGGLFDVQLSPNYSDTKWIYFSYNKDIDGQGATTLARAKLKDQRLIDWQDLLVTKSTSPKNVHFGGRISFDNDNHLFLGIGDRGIRSMAQALSNHAGSIIRLNLDGSIPKDNPFINNNKALPEIWSFGHRNPQGLFFNTQTQQLWEVEHGPRGGDEINLIEAGKNYGWPIISYGKEYWGPIAVGEGSERDGMEQPVKSYVPSIATSSIIQYTNQLFKGWQGSLLVGALKSQHLNQVYLDNDGKAIIENKLFRDIKGRIRNIIESPEGWLYLSTDDGRILKVSPHSE
ncbi:MAG: PQQ-dependent sugar dehydrogenase [Methylophagaceae bacterium]